MKTLLSCVPIQLNYYLYYVFIIFIYLLQFYVSDSLAYQIQADDFYAELLDNPNLLNGMDTANLPQSNSCYIVQRKKIPDLFSNEPTKSQYQIHFPKMYSMYI